MVDFQYLYKGLCGMAEMPLKDVPNAVDQITARPQHTPQPTGNSSCH